MGQPVNNGIQHPVIRQAGESGTLGLADRGDWSTQDDGREHLDRVAVQWFREHLPLGSGAWESVSPELPGQRSEWDEKQPAEAQLVLGIGAENIGRRFRALVAVGYGPSFDASVGKTFVEWGRTRSVHTGELAYSNVLTVQPWATTPPPTPPPPVTQTSTQVRKEMAAIGKQWMATQSGPIELSRIPLAVEILDMLDERQATTRRPYRFGWSKNLGRAIHDLLHPNGEVSP